MIQKLKNVLLGLALVSSMLFGTMAVNMSSAAALDCSNAQTQKEKIDCGVCTVNPAECNKDPDETLQGTIRNVINVISIIAGAVAVIMIVWGGFRYITSGGNAETVKSARNTILYALIGLVIIAFAQVIVRFTLSSVD